MEELILSYNYYDKKIRQTPACKALNLIKSHQQCTP